MYACTFMHVCVFVNSCVCVTVCRFGCAHLCTGAFISTCEHWLETEIVINVSHETIK